MRIDFIIAKDSHRLHEGETAGQSCHLLSLADGLNAALKEASRAPVDILWISYEALESPDPNAIRRFRVARPETRIILEVPDDLAPPNDFISAIVGMGVLDIVIHAYSLAEALDRHPTYADAARWQGGGLSWEDEAAPVAQAAPKERIIERKIASTNRPAIIAVRGVLPGSGTTLLATTITLWLASHGWPSAMLEWPPDRKPSDLRRFGAAAEKLPPGAAIYPTGTATLESILSERKAAYIVLDLGTRPQSPSLPLLPDLELVVLPATTRWEQVPQLVGHLSLRAGADLGAPAQRVLWWSGPPDPAVQEQCWHLLPPPDSTWPPTLSPALSTALGTLLAPIRPDYSVPGWLLWLKKHEDHLVPWALWAGGLVVLGLLAHALAAHGWPRVGLPFHHVAPKIPSTKGVKP